MIVLGLILIVLAAASGTLLFLAAQPLTDPVELEAMGVQASVLPLVLLIAGAAVMLLLWLGLVMIRGSVRRKTRRRRESKDLERQAEREAQGRRDAESRTAAAPAPAPAARFADTRQRPDDGWAEDETHARAHDADDRSGSGSHETTRTDRSTGPEDHDSREARRV